ncbi:unnamed protein product [Tilletia laevis]|uniref:RNA methyltransferase n=2 Tax=Tilletia TaxID=13289 RepID=A0A177UPL6_9BASI|nr:hypothetical protein CF336_g4867 [Tilletia laevis]KAE8259344.1 hypothetical protein A4X03_0g4118 [Tilletia caries]KAE8199744.1 hypothetical protein CF335_g4099 [Tilletia laevis]CAD6891000.1 unnamed protein product [Tilletia caries]CAD6899482.1 unnamed protein product [Tilletia caries]
MSRKKKGKLRQIEASRVATTEAGAEAEAEAEVKVEVEVAKETKGSQGGQESRSDAAKLKPKPSVEKSVKVDKEPNTRFRPIHGNFRNYYTIRGRSAGSQAGDRRPETIWTPSTSAVVLNAKTRDDIDPRLRHLLNWTATANSSAQLPYKRILDIGSNSGQVTLELAEAVTYIYGRAPTCVLGVDIDDELTQQARHALAHAREREAGPLNKRRRMDALALPIPVQEHSISMFQPRKVKAKLAAVPKSTVANLNSSTKTEPPSSSSGQHQNSFAASVDFRTADWVKEGSGSSIADPSSRADVGGPGWDLILGLSLTKWVHINNGTEGILRLFGRIAASLRCPTTSASSSSVASTSSSPHGTSCGGGVFLLEPQAWSSYQTARSQGADVRARIRALRSAAPLERSLSTTPTAQTTKKRKRDEEEVTLDNSAQPAVDDENRHADSEEYGYPPITPADFPFILTVLFGLEGPIEIGHSQGAGFQRPLQIYIQPDFSKLPVNHADGYREARDAAVQGCLVLPWVPREFK